MSVPKKPPGYWEPAEGPDVSVESLDDEEFEDEEDRTPYYDDIPDITVSDVERWDRCFKKMRAEKRRIEDQPEDRRFGPEDE